MHRTLGQVQWDLKSRRGMHLENEESPSLCEKSMVIKIAYLLVYGH